MEFSHVTVLLNETVDLIDVKAGGIYADLTLGGGGHTNLILSRGGSVIGIDRDMDAINACRERFKDFGERFKAVHANYAELGDVLKDLGVAALDGIVMDLGVSSHQLDMPQRGFSYMQDSPLDMRMDQSDEKSAYDVVNGYPERELCRVITDYGEERWAKRIAQFIAERRSEKPIETTFELVDAIKAAIPASARKDGPHPAKRTFQAIRIEVNRELELLFGAVEGAVSCLKSGGRIGVITFHSLEDRIIKECFNSLARGCTCPKDFPVCVCGKKEKVKVLTRKPILPSQRELEKNPRARSAKLRGAEKL